MNFNPEQPFDTNRGENVVWAALKAALGALPGDIFYRLPIIGSDGFVRYEPDIVVIPADSMPLIVECKGCRIDQIEDIQGAVWRMGSTWYRSQERPVTQARDQAIAFRAMLEVNGVDGIYVHAMVALPFVSRDSWASSPFGSAALTSGILFAEDLEPERLKQKTLEFMEQQPLDASRSSGLLRCLGARTPFGLDGEGAARPPAAKGGADTASATAPAAGKPSPIKLLRYQGKPPSAEELRSVIGFAPDTPYTYLVATGALERLRSAEGLGGQHQLRKDLRRESTDPEQMELLFHKAMRLFIGKPVLTRAEEGLVLQRAVRAVAAGVGQGARDQLLRDVFAWRDVLAELEETGCDLAQADQEPEAEWAHPQLREVARKLQAAYRKARQQAGRGRTSFEDLAGQYLDTSYRPTSIVIMEGFTRLTPLQQRFIKACVDHGCDLWILQPYCVDQKAGFAALERTYAPLKDLCQLRKLDTEPLSAEPALQHVQRGLFGVDVAQHNYNGDESVVLNTFSHRNDEVAAVVEAVIQSLEDPQRSLGAADVAVVCSDPIGMAPLLREEAELRGRPELFAVPPRQLLLTPVGRFALTLYEAWTPEGLNLNPDQFATLLAAGWLGGHTQRSVDQFQAVAAQQFTHCRTESEWHAAFDRIRAQRDGEERLDRLPLRLPASQVSLTQLHEWEEALRTVVRLCRRLLRPGERSLGEHIRQLLDEIEQLDANRMLQAERAVLTQIRDALAELTEAHSVAVDGHEFGQILSGLIHEREDPGELRGAEVGRFPRRVWVVGPEGIDNVTRDTVFFIGLEDAQLPAAGLPPWPRGRWSAQEHIERQRYRFLAVARAARRRLWLSHAWQDWERNHRPSPYIEDAAHLIMRAIPPQPVQAMDPPPPQPRQGEDSGLRLTRDTYSLEEIALFRLCPHRFKLEALSPWGQCYRDTWQLGWMARGVWLAETYGQVADTVPYPATPHELEDALKRAVDAVRPAVEARFAGLSPLDWLSIARAVRNSIAYLLEPWWDGTVPLNGIRRGESHGFSTAIEPQPNRPVRIEAHAAFLQHRDGKNWPIPDSDQAGTWLMAGRRNAGAEANVQDPALAANQYEAVRWWRDLLRALSKQRPLSPAVNNQLIDVVLDVEKARFPKNPGDHCDYCPVKATCMGLEP